MELLSLMEGTDVSQEAALCLRPQAEQQQSPDWDFHGKAVSSITCCRLVNS